jgi:uncharacterized protein
MGLLIAVALAAATQVAVSSIFIESTIQAPGPEGPLAGTMLAPEAPAAPVVLIIPGSGPTNHDGNGPRGVKASTYRLIAEDLAARGIASVRIDKRGQFASRTAVSDPNAVTIGDYAADVRTWVSVIRQKTGVACVWVLGHSEGGLVGLVASQKPADMCGLILVATVGRPLGTVLREQLRSNPANAPVLDLGLAAIADLEAGKKVDKDLIPPAFLPLLRPAVQDFLIATFALDPVALIANCHIPVLIVQGRRDIQVGVADAERLAHADPAARLVLLPDTNHVLKVVTSDDRDANTATYMTAGLPLAPGVIDAISSFIAPPAVIR